EPQIVRFDSKFFVRKCRPESSVERVAQNRDGSLQNLRVEPTVRRFSAQPMNQAARPFTSHARAQKSNLAPAEIQDFHALAPAQSMLENFPNHLQSVEFTVRHGQ